MIKDNNKIELTSEMNVLDVYEVIIPNYPTFDNYIDKWLHYRITTEVPFGDQMTDLWDCDANEHVLKYFNQLFEGDVVSRDGYKYQIDMEKKKPKYNIYLRLDTFFSPATPIKELLMENYKDYIFSTKSAAYMLKQIIEDKVLSDEHRNAIENLLKLAYTPGNMLPIPAGGRIAMNPIRWSEQKDQISSYFKTINFFYEKLADDTRMGNAVLYYKVFYSAFDTFDDYIDAMSLKPFLSMEDGDMASACEAIEKRCKLLSEAIATGKKIL